MQKNNRNVRDSKKLNLKKISLGWSFYLWNTGLETQVENAPRFIIHDKSCTDLRNVEIKPY